MGELAALTTALCWSLNSIQFTLAGQRVGSQVVNRSRLLLAVLFLSLTHWLMYGQVWPLQAEPFRWGWLGLSGIIGLILGDSSLFQSFLLIGPRRAMLLMTLVPVISTLLAWGWFGETLQPVEIGAVLLTIGGIAWVIAEKPPPSESRPASWEGEDRRRTLLGVLLGLGGALGQALGLVIAKHGLSGDFPALSATLIRMVIAAGVLWLLTLARGQGRATWRALVDVKALLSIVGGSLAGPFIGVWLSMVAVQHAPVGIASTLMALSPILVIPLEHWVLRKSVSPRAVAGTVVALVGAGMILMA
ncbi:MAG TPA: EamA family transporter [Chloroflexi bacterium]|nr:EamA family transporter [Chloroflexota bacterium]